MSDDPIARIRQLYFTTTRATIARDLARAIALLKRVPEAERSRAHVYMEGLAEMRREFAKGRNRQT
jgi:hypothetical protein